MLQPPQDVNAVLPHVVPGRFKIESGCGDDVRQWLRARTHARLNYFQHFVCRVRVELVNDSDMRAKSIQCSGLRTQGFHEAVILLKYYPVLHNL